MKKVLVIAYAFPPFGGGEVMRAAKFVKYLPSMGWLPVVLTVANQDCYVSDSSLADDISKEVIIRTARTLEPKLLIKRVKEFIRNAGRKGASAADVEIAASSGIIYRVGRLKDALAGAFLIPSEEVLWNAAAFKEACRIAGEGIDMVFTTSPPHSVQLIGERLKRRFNVPWVADFRDAWAGNVLFKPAYKLRARMEERMERRVAEGADFVVSATEPITANFARRYPGLSGKFVTITNGFDSGMFKDAKRPRNEKLTLTYAGGIGGRRTPRYVYEALIRLKEKMPDVYSGIRVRFVGSFYDDKRPWQSNLAGCVEFTPHVPYKDVIPIMQASDVLLLVLHPVEGGETLATGKLYEYIGAERPILATVPECVAKEMVVENRLGIAVPPDDAVAISDAIAELHGRWKADTLELDVSNDFRERFDRKGLTKKLAALFDEASGSERAR